MNIEQKHELMFIIAKYLKTLFPDVAETFIQRCESENLFPKAVFSQNATFDELQTSFLSGVPDDQLIRIILHAQNNSKFSSLLASMNQNTNSNYNIIENNNSNGGIDQKFFNDLLCDSLRNQIDPLQTVIPPFHRFGAHHRIISHLDKIFCLAVDFTSQVLITGSDDFLVKIWKIPEMIPMKMFNVHIDSITDLQIHPNNLYFCSSSHDSTITVFSFQNNGRVVIKLKMNNMVHNIKFSPCGTFLGAASHEGCVSIWNFNDIIEYDKNIQNPDKSKKPKYNIEPIKVIHSPQDRPAAWLSFSPNGGFVVFSCDPNMVIVSSLNEDYSVQLCGHIESPDFVFFSKISCNRILSLSCQERCVRFWESQNDIWDKSTSLTNARKVKIHRATFNCDESRIVGVSTKMITVWDTYSKQQLFILTHSDYADYPTIVASHPTIPAVVFVATSKGKTSLWDVINGQLICGLQSKEGDEILEAIWSPDGQYIFTSDVKGGVTIYMADTNNKNRKTSDLVPYTEMFFLNEIIETQENEVSQNKKAVKENTFKDKSLFNQAYYRKVNCKNYEVDTLITDANGNPLLPQPKRWFLSDLRLQIDPNSSRTIENRNIFDEEESIALNLMKALFTQKNRKNNSDINHSESTVIPFFNDEENIQNQNGDDIQFKDSDDGYETSFDGENIQRRRKKSREEAEREREERLQRRHRRLEESRNDSGFSSESTIASRRTRRKRNQSKEAPRKNLSRSSSLSTTNLLRKRSSRIKLNELNESNSDQDNGEDQEYEMDPANEYEDENEEYEDELQFEKEIEEEEEEEENKTPKKQQQNKKNTRIRQSRNSKFNSRSTPKSKSKSNTSTKKQSRTRQQIPALSSQSSYIDNGDNDEEDDDTLESNDYSSSSSDSEPRPTPIRTSASRSTTTKSNSTKNATTTINTSPSLLPSWTFSVKRSIHTYIPQIGDEVVYLRKGHSDWKEECSLMNFTPPYKIKPDLPQVAEARISDLKFYISHLVITLQFYSQKLGNLKKGKNTDESFEEIVKKFAINTDKSERKVSFEAKIAYPMPDSPQFIIQKSRFVYSMLYTLFLKPTDIVEVEFATEKAKAPTGSKSHQRKNEIDNDVQLFQGKVKSISQNWINDPWQCINVIFTDDNKPGKLQPWELIFSAEKIKKDLIQSIHNIKSKEDEDYDEYSDDDEDDDNNIVAYDAKLDNLNDYLVHFVSEMLQKKENASFVFIRSPEFLKILRKKSKFPIDLTLISDRLANRWYTSVESLKSDVNLIKSNTLVLNKLNNKMADRIVEQLMKKIETFSITKGMTKKAHVAKESDSDSETDSDSTLESDSDSSIKTNMKTRNNNNKQNIERKNTPQKPTSIQTRNKRNNPQQKSNLRPNIKKKSESDSEQDSSTLSTVSSTTSASSSVTATSSESE